VKGTHDTGSQHEMDRTMGYTPKHAKPASLRETAPASSRRHGLFAISEPSKGRHTTPAGTRQDGGAAAPAVPADQAA
jgi:hypothetical protein